MFVLKEERNAWWRKKESAERDERSDPRTGQCNATGMRQPRNLVHAKHDEHSHTLAHISKSKTKTVGAY